MFGARNREHAPSIRGMQGKIGCTYAVYVARKRAEEAPDDFVSFKDISCANIFTARNLVPLLFTIRSGSYRSRRALLTEIISVRSVDLGFDLKASFLAFCPDTRTYVYYIVRASRDPLVLMT